MDSLADAGSGTRLPTLPHTSFILHWQIQNMP